MYNSFLSDKKKRSESFDQEKSLNNTIHNHISKRNSSLLKFFLHNFILGKIPFLYANHEKRLDEALEIVFIPYNRI